MTVPNFLSVPDYFIDCDSDLILEDKEFSLSEIPNTMVSDFCVGEGDLLVYRLQDKLPNNPYVFSVTVTCVNLRTGKALDDVYLFVRPNFSSRSIQFKGE